MSNEELSNEFDTYVQAKSVAFGHEAPLAFNEYEKSLFLTRAQEEIVIGAYKGGGSMEGFESTEELRRYLVELVKTRVYNPVKVNSDECLTDKSYSVNLDKDVMFIVYEQAEIDDATAGCHDGIRTKVSPISHDEFDNIIENPFKCPSYNRVCRLDSNLDNGKIELISEYNISKYRIKALIKPSPIVLVDLGELSIDGVSTKTECLLNPVLHRVIVKKAVALALASRSTNG